MKISNSLRAIPRRLLVLLLLGIVNSLMIVVAGVIRCPDVGTTCTGSDRSEIFILVGSPSAPTTTNITLLNAGGGNDRVTVSSIITTNITINGQGGNDAIFDGAGNGTLNGGDGNDRIDGNGGNDTISGGLGNDQLNGGIGDDTINGDAGNDRIIGGPGTDTINGGPGNDIIDPGPDADGSSSNPITGGGGNDLYILRRGETGTGNSTEYILCTTNSSDRSIVRLVGFSRDDPALPPKLPARLQADPGPGFSIYTDIRDGAGVFRIYHGPGECIVTAVSR